MSNELEGQVAIVTGAAAGLGFAIATKLAAQGARVLFCDLDAETAQAAAQTTGKQTAAVQIDVTNNAQVEERIARSATDWVASTFS